MPVNGIHPRQLRRRASRILPPQYHRVHYNGGETAAIYGGGGVLGGADTVSIHNWLLCYEEASSELPQIAAYLTDWIANELPSWEEYHALIEVQLISLDKHTGVIPVGIGETWR